MVLTSLFEKQKKNLSYFFSHLDLLEAQKNLQILQQSKGLLFFSGVGKSGAIAKKLAATFLSLGMKAFYLDPLEALHGDLGALSVGDILILLSKSGETKELLRLLCCAKEKKATTMAWVCKDPSSLKEKADYSLYLPMENELCPFDLVPTTSAAIQLIFGDLLAVALMEIKQFSLEDYAKNHPSGSIGKKIAYSVEDLMLKDHKLPLCHKKALLRDILVEFSEKKCGCIVIVDDQKKVEGIFTDGDLRRALQKSDKDILNSPIEDLMNKNFIFIHRSEKLHKALEVMQQDQQKWVSALPVIEENRIIGLLRMHDIIHFSN